MTHFQVFDREGEKYLRLGNSIKRKIIEIFILYLVQKVLRLICRSSVLAGKMPFNMILAMTDR